MTRALTNLASRRSTVRACKLHFTSLHLLASEEYAERLEKMDSTLATAKEVIAERVSQREGGHAQREASAARVSAALTEWTKSRAGAREALAERRAAYVRRKADEAEEKARAAATAAAAAHGSSGDENEQPAEAAAAAAE